MRRKFHSCGMGCGGNAEHGRSMWTVGVKLWSRSHLIFLHGCSWAAWPMVWSLSSPAHPGTEATAATQRSTSRADRATATGTLALNFQRSLRACGHSYHAWQLSLAKACQVQVSTAEEQKPRKAKKEPRAQKKSRPQEEPRRRHKTA